MLAQEQSANGRLLEIGCCVRESHAPIAAMIDHNLLGLPESTGYPTIFIFATVPLGIRAPSLP
jgi:hypothetical protein